MGSEKNIDQSDQRAHWTALIRSKLVPLNLMIPMAAGLYEWSPIFRDLVFDIADFLKGKKSRDWLGLVREFRKEHRRELLRNFSDEELSLLFLKAEDYELVTGR